MAFDERAFLKAKAEPRTARVAVAALAGFFGADEEAAFTVRGLSGAELARVNEAVAKNKNLAAIVQALAGQTSDPEKLKELMGLSNSKQPDEIVKRMEMLTLGAVDPPVSMPVAIKIAEVAPAEFFLLTNEVTRLTGEGAELGKPKPSGSEPTCETA